MTKMFEGFSFYRKSPKGLSITSTSPGESEFMRGTAFKNACSERSMSYDQKNSDSGKLTIRFYDRDRAYEAETLMIRAGFTRDK